MVNHHISRGKVQKVLEHLIEITSNSREAIHITEVELYETDIGNFVEGLRSKTYGQLRDVSLSDVEPTPYEIKHARKDGILEPLRREDYLCLTPELTWYMSGKVITHYRQANQSSGNKFNVRRKRMRIRNHKKRAGNGFSFKPEIPHLRAGDGIVCSTDVYDYLGEDFDISEFGIFPNNYHHLEDDIGLPRYSHRRNHPAQSIPKVEWDVRRARRIGNKGKTSKRKHHRRVIMSHSKEQLKEARAAMDRTVEMTGTIPQFTGTRSSNYW